MISGRIISIDNGNKNIVDFATVYLNGTKFGGSTNREGFYHIHALQGDYTLVVSAVGYRTVEKKVSLKRGERIKMNITLVPKGGGGKFLRVK